MHNQRIPDQPVVATTVYTPVRNAGNLKSKNDVVGEFVSSVGVIGPEALVCLSVCKAVVWVSAGRCSVPTDILVQRYAD